MHLAKSLAAFIATENVTGGNFARICGLHPATVSRLNAGERPALETLKAICTRYPNKTGVLGLLVAHLRDEIERAGRSQAEIEVSVNRLADDDIHTLADCAREDADLAAILHDLAQLARRMRDKSPAAIVRYPLHADGPEQAVAEEQAPYGTQTQSQSLSTRKPKK